MVINLDRQVYYVGAAHSERPKGGSSGSGWRVNTAKNRATRKKVGPSTVIASTAFGKEEIAVHL
jgi:hypothetical protein